MISITVMIIHAFNFYGPGIGHSQYKEYTSQQDCVADIPRAMLYAIDKGYEQISIECRTTELIREE